MEKNCLQTSLWVPLHESPLEFQDCGTGLNAAQFKQLLISALKDLFGEVDAALPLDVLTYEEKTLSAILRICSRYDWRRNPSSVTEQRLMVENSRSAPFREWGEFCPCELQAAFGSLNGGKCEHLPTRNLQSREPDLGFTYRCSVSQLIVMVADSEVGILQTCLIEVHSVFCLDMVCFCL